MSEYREAHHKDIYHISDGYGYEFNPISREKADKTIGLSWSNMGFVVPDREDPLYRVQDFMKRLSNVGYIVTIEQTYDTPNGWEIHISASHKTGRRLSVDGGDR